jgi:hypothetical protein
MFHAKPISPSIVTTAGAGGENWLYPHRCEGAWQQIRPTIMSDTHAAVLRWMTDNNHSQPGFMLGDVVIQSRCSKGTLIGHPEYGPVGFSFYNTISAIDTKTIYIITNRANPMPACAAIRAALLQHLHGRYPGVRVHLVGGTREDDFFRMLFAPVLYRDSQSTFGLWAGMANKGLVHSVPMLRAFTDNVTPDFGDGWHWDNVPVLYPAVAAAHGIKADDADAIVNWLLEH